MDGDSAPNSKTLKKTVKLLKVWYFVAFAQYVFLQPFLNVYFKQLGLNEQQIGVISGLRPWVAALAAFIVPYVTDLSQQHDTVQLLSQVLQLCFRMMLLVFVLYPQQLLLILISDFFRSPILIVQDTKTVTVCQIINQINGQDNSEKNKDNDQNYEKQRNQVDYGKIRLWGAASWGSISIVAGYTLSQSSFKVNFLMYAVLGVIVFFLTIWIDQYYNTIINSNKTPSTPTPTPNTQNIKSVQKDGSQKSCNQKEKLFQNNVVLALLNKPQVFSFYLMALFFGSATGIIEGYLFLYLQELGGSALLMGLTLTLTCTSEVPVFQFFSNIEKKLGLDLIFDLVFVAFIVRLLCYAGLKLILTNYTLSVYIILPVELLHGITFGCTWSACTLKSRQLSVPGFETSFQGFFNCMYSGVGRGLGGGLGGWIYYNYSPEKMFLVTAQWMFIGWVITRGLSYLQMLVQQNFGKRDTKYTNLMNVLPK